MWKKVLSIAGAIVLLSSLIAGSIKLNEHFATAFELRQNQVQDRIDTLESNIRWYNDQQRYLRNSYGVRDPQNLPNFAFEDYMDYEKSKQQDQDKLKALRMQVR